MLSRHILAFNAVVTMWIFPCYDCAVPEVFFLQAPFSLIDSESPLFSPSEWHPRASSSLFASMTRCWSVLLPGESSLFTGGLRIDLKTTASLSVYCTLTFFCFSHFVFLPPSLLLLGIQRLFSTTFTSCWSVPSWCHASCTSLKARWDTRVE